MQLHAYTQTRLGKSFQGALAAALLLATLGACTNMNDTQQRVVSGAAIGAGAGAVGTVLTGGCIACGAAVGGAVGAASGYVVDQIKKK